MERTPVEVWQKILRLAIACPLLPPDEEYNHFHIQTIAKVTCTLFAEYKQSERIRTNLRLVCSGWNEFLEEYSDRLVRLSPYVADGHWPPVKRWDRVVRLEGSQADHDCGTSCWRDRLERPKLEIRERNEATIKNTYLPLLGNQCRAVLYPGHWRSELERLDHITMLNYGTLEARDPGVCLSGLNKYTNLRHLQIKLVTLVSPSVHIELPSLNTLSILLQSGRFGSPVQSPVLPSHIGVWNLPKLHYLEFSSAAVYVQDFEMLNILLGQVGKTITHFHLGGGLLSNPCTRLLDKLWGFLPSLGSLGIGIYCLSHMPGPPNDHHSPLVNILVDTCHKNKVWFWHGLARELITELPRNWEPGRLGEVRLETTWEKLLDEIRKHRIDVQIRAPLSDRDFLIGDVAIFDILHTTGEGLADCDGVPFDNEIRGSILSVASQVGLE